MPTLRSKTDASEVATFAFRSELPVSSIAAMVPFMRETFRIKWSLDASIARGDGVVSYVLTADLRGRRFTVESTWTDEAAFGAWVGAEPHRSAMAALRERVSGATFATEELTPR